MIYINNKYDICYNYRNLRSGMDTFGSLTLTVHVQRKCNIKL
jgi:hypothetical protein